MTPTPGRAKAACYFAAFVALGLVSASLGPTLPALAARTGSSLGAASALFVARSLGYLAGTVAGGRAYDRIAGHPVLAAVLAAMAAAVALAPVAPWLGAVTAALAVVGIAEGMLDVGANTLVVWEFRERAAPVMTALHACFGVGAFLSPIVVAAVAARGGVVWAYWVLAIAIAPLSPWLARLPSPVAWHTTSGGRAGRADRGLLALVTLFFIVYVGSEASVGGWVFTYTVATGLGDETMGAYLSSAFWGALALGRALAIPIAARRDPRAVLAVALAGGLASVLAVLAVPGALWALWAGTIGTGLSLAVVFPATLSLAGRYMRISGSVNSWFFAGASIGGMALPWAIGQLFERAGPRVTFALVAADLVASGIVLAAIVLWLRNVGGRPQGTRR